MLYEVHSMGVHYASFQQEEDAQKWAMNKSIAIAGPWWEVRRPYPNSLLYPAGAIIAFAYGEVTHGKDNLLI